MKPRIPEGGAILNSKSLSTDEYSAIMHKSLGDEYRRFAENAERILGVPAGGRILEIGPGPGWAGLALLSLRPDITLVAVEPSADMIRTATRNAEEAGFGARTRYVYGFVEKIPDCAGDAVLSGFDGVISRDSLHHWAKPGKGFGEINRVLGKNGRIYVADSKRNLALRERFIVRSLGKKMADSQFSGWKNSIRASYTEHELRIILAAEGLGEWNVETGFLRLSVQGTRIA